MRRVACGVLSLGCALLIWDCGGESGAQSPLAPADDAAPLDGAISDGAGDEVAPPLTFDALITPVDAGPLCDRFGDGIAICEQFDETNYFGGLQQVGFSCDGIASLAQGPARYRSPYHSLRASYDAVDASTQAQCFLSTRIPVAKNYEVTFAIYLEEEINKGGWADVMGLIYNSTRLSIVIDGQNRPGIWRQNGPQAAAGGPLPIGQWMTMGFLVSNDDVTVKATLTINGVVAVTLDYPSDLPWADPFAGIGIIEAYGDGVPHTISFDDYAIATN